MALQYLSPPEESTYLAQTGLRQMAEFAQQARITDLMELGAGEAELSAPHAVHLVGLDDLTARRPVHDLPVTGWRYLALVGSRAVASSEVLTGTGGRPAMLEQVNMGPYVEATAQALAELAEAADLQAGSFEVHMLKIPALCALVLWLSEADGERNLFVPLPPAPDFLQAGRVYHEAELLDSCEGAARRRLEFGDPGQGPFDHG